MAHNASSSTEMAINAHRLDFTSGVNGKNYRLLVSVPAGEAPEGGWPVVYLIDGSLHFGIAVYTARIQACWPESRDPVIVGIAYQTDSVAEALQVRNHDLTPDIKPYLTDTGWMKAMGSKPEDYGGLHDYLRMIEEEVKPKVAGIAPVNPGDQILMGHSLGGLTTLYTLLHNPGAFQQYVAISPSIWFNDCWVTGFVDGFVNALEAGKVDARLLLSTGEFEEIDPPFPPYPKTGFPASEEDYRGMTHDCGMVRFQRAIAERLEPLRSSRFDIRFVVHPEEDHRTVVPAGIARGIFYTMYRPAT